MGLGEILPFTQVFGSPLALSTVPGITLAERLDFQLSNNAVEQCRRLFWSGFEVRFGR